MPAEGPRLRLLAPRYWPTWVGLGLLRLCALLPYPVQLAISRAVGRALMPLMREQTRIARRNLELCLPELDGRARARLLRRHFASLVMGLFETANGWWRPDRFVDRLARLEGVEHLERALGRGRGAILLGTHFTTTEFAVRILARQLALSAQLQLNVMYRPTKNELLGEFLRRNRARRLKRAIPRDDIRTLVGALRGNECVWFAPDQSYRKKGAVMVPLFGVPAPSNPATSRLAALTGAAVLPYFVGRLPGSQGYRATIHPPLEDFPGQSPAEDGERINRIIEAEIRRVPEQYLWIHKRFKRLRREDTDYYLPQRS